jgi:hypothetical protein
MKYEVKEKVHHSYFIVKMKSRSVSKETERLHMFLFSLRRHYPHQVLGSPARDSQPRDLRSSPEK